MEVVFLAIVLSGLKEGLESIRKVPECRQDFSPGGRGSDGSVVKSG